MEFTENFKAALDGINTNKMRSFLSMLGIIIGIVAVITVVSITQGSQESISERIRGLGTNLITVTPGRRGGFSGSRAQILTEAFTIEEGEEIRKRASAVKLVVPIIRKTLLIQYKDKNLEIRVNGVTPEYQEVMNFWVERGKFIDSRDIKNSRTVVVLGQEVANELFGKGDPLGKDIIINTSLSRYKFRVIGIMESKGQVMFSNFDNQTYVPVTTAQNRLLNVKYVTSFSIQAQDEESTNDAVEQIDAILYQKFQDDAKYRIRSQEQLLSTMESTMEVFTIMLASVAGISLLVGGIGIMNIMLVSVTERTREIGIRMAIGAKRKDILLQFLSESVILCLVGGAIGIALGWVTSSLIASIQGWPTLISFWAIVIALSFSTLVGLFFGIYPANEASKMNPVEALRYE
ncbi:ABC transporter permease [Patescibacteria group bacterium]|nr:ABC transporter permease [Patescibacteria group bacterium]